MKTLQIRRLVDESHTRDQTHNNNANTAEDDESKKEKKKNKDAKNSTLT